MNLVLEEVAQLGSQCSVSKCTPFLQTLTREVGQEQVPQPGQVVRFGRIPAGGTHAGSGKHQRQQAVHVLALRPTEQTPQCGSERWVCDARRRIVLTHVPLLLSMISRKPPTAASSGTMQNSPARPARLGMDVQACCSKLCCASVVHYI